MRTLGVVTVGRSDYGIYLPVLRRIESTADLSLRLYVAGMHLSPQFGLTVQAVEEDGFDIAERVEIEPVSDTPGGIAKAMGTGVMGFSEVFSRGRPDLLIVLGDRFEMYTAALAALPFKIPVAHIHGGELTEGAIDDALRHSITKLSHLHFVATEEYRRRVVQLGEEPSRVVVSGAPSLDNLRSKPLLGVSALSERLGVPMDPPPLLATFHPVTLEYERTEWHVVELLAALESSGMPVVFTSPNADIGGSTVRKAIDRFVSVSPRAHLAENLGTRAYFSLMSVAAAMIGNSSSGLIEAPSFELPVVNIGSRQDGRVRADNVIDVGYGRDDVLAGIRKAVSTEFPAGLRGLVNPYGDGSAARRIVDYLRQVALTDDLVKKRFHDLRPAEVMTGAAV